MNSSHISLWITMILLALSTGCTSLYRNGNGIPYVALERPTGVIQTSMNQGYQSYTWNRSGPYFLNAGFRPAPDIGSYLSRAHWGMGQSVLRNADVRLYAPMLILPLPMGFQIQPLDGPDTVSVNRNMP